MHLHFAIQHVLGQLSATISLLNQAQYAQPSSHLSNATIGQHTRHIIEMFQCLLAGYASGELNYENRARDQRIENDPMFALQLIKTLFTELDKSNKSLLLQAAYQDDSNELTMLETNYFREIAYNLEHTIHHMALIKVGILELADIHLPEGFGVAPSTLKYKKTCAQ
jgi:hypothetical protein